MSETVRMAELLGGLTLASDVANNSPPEKALRTVVLAIEVGRRHGISEVELRDTFYVSLLRYLGCVSFAHEEAQLYGAGDDIGVRYLMSMSDASDMFGTARRIIGRLGKGAAIGERVRGVARILGDGVAVERHANSQCDASKRFAKLTHMPDSVGAALDFVCERWDGKGHPSHISGEAIPIAIRLHHLADVVEIALHRAGPEAAIDLARKRSGGAIDPQLARTFLDAAPELLATIDVPSIWDRFLANEPRPHLEAHPNRVDEVARAFAMFADLKSTFTLGHSTAVAELATRAGQASGLAGDELTNLRRAGWLHDLGRVAVANGIWDKPGKLSVAEWERVRMHAYWTERALWQARPLRPIAQLAAGAHERSDGTGYHRSLPGSVLSRAARILAAADAYQAMRELRPYRPAHSAESAARELRAEVTAGKIDREACAAVLEAAGIEVPRMPWPCGLTDREVTVLRLVARGGSNKQIGAELGISPKTVQHHVAHLYAKIGVASRAGAALFATEHGLLGP